MDLFANLALGAAEAFTLTNLFLCFLGVLIGTMVGVLPGLGTLVAIPLLLPVTYHLDASGAMIMLAGVYFGTDFGGGTCSIMLNVPGHAAAVVTSFDGNPMARQGRAGVALFMKCIASVWGSAVGIILLMLFAPLMTDIALQFHAAEFSMLMLFSLVASSAASRGSPIKGLAMMVIGLALGLVGTDVNSGEHRFTFDVPELSGGLSVVAMAMGLFAITEVIKSANQSVAVPPSQSLSLRNQLPTREDWRRSWAPMLRGSGLGAFFGMLPGTGSGAATFVSYAIEKRISKNPEKFGKGAIEGLVAPEACNNGGVASSYIPTLTLGIPGDPTMALILGALIVQGIQPGPRVISSNPELFWALIVSFWVGNIILVILNIPLIGIWVRMLSIPYRLIFPAIILFSCIGVYSTQNNAFDVYVLLGFGIFGIAMMLLRFDIVPLLLGYILGPMFEENFRRALLLSRGDFTTFLERPISAVALGATVLLLFVSLRSYLRRTKFDTQADNQSAA